MLVKTRKNVFVPSFVDGFFGNDLLEGFSEAKIATSPAHVNIAENEAMYRVEIAFPGVDKDKFEVDITDNILTVTVKNTLAEVQSEESAENTDEAKIKLPEFKYSKREFLYTTFNKQFTLPETADANAISAEHKNGILYLSIPKKAEEKIEPRKIAIN